MNSPWAMGPARLVAVAGSALILSTGASASVPRPAAAIPDLPAPVSIQQADAMDPLAVVQRIKDSPSMEAVADRAALSSARVAGDNGSWTPLGSKPDSNTVPGYDGGIGYASVSGRIQSFTYDPATDRVWAAVGAGGVWETDDMGQTWHSISDNLSTQAVGALGWSPAQGGTLIAATGDSGYEYWGQGVWRTLDGGRTWLRSAGVPEGALSYRVAVSPDNPNLVYVATTKGLWVSHDDAATFQNAMLPTTCTDLNDPHCYYANWVTDVVVHPGSGHVLAAVGWYEGARMIGSGTTWPMSPQNGLYESDSGAPGTFTYLSPSGFTSQAETGNIRLGEAMGPDQNHDIVYAAVQNVALLLGQVPVVDVSGPKAIPWNTNLDGVYESTDFGQTWTERMPAQMLQTPASESALIGYQQPGYSPGIQSWYNLYVQPDPTQTSNGAPTRVFLGLEELFESSTDASQPGPLQFHAIGRYWAGTACFGGLAMPSAVPYCPTTVSPTGQTTTHADQHAILLVPDGKGGETMFAGNDGGAFTQHVDSSSDFSNGGWGNGANVGLHTLYPYMAVVAGDGTAYAGLQDNGEDKITPDGQQIMVYGGDAFFSAVDPNNSRTAYEEYTYGAMNVTTDGGMTWNAIGPSLTSSQFSTPFAMDPENANHLVIGGRNIEETTSGPNTTVPGTVCVGQYTTPVVGQTCEGGLPVTPATSNQSTDWQQVYDLGTLDDPGGITGSAGDLTTSAIAIQGANVYAGWCPSNHSCTESYLQNYAYKTGIATNVGGPQAPQSGTSNGWHIAAAKGLPPRTVTSIAIAPNDARTIYVSLSEAGQDPRHEGESSSRAAIAGTGHLYVSHDAGQTFTNISGNLPDTPANWVAIRGTQLIVATDVGAFISSDLTGATWGVLGGGQLPVVPITSVQLQPGNPNVLVAAAYGRGMWKYTFPTTAAPVTTGLVHAAAHTATLPNTSGGPAIPWLPLLPAPLLLLPAVLVSRLRRD